MLLRDLAPASFRGVPFLMPRDTAEEGRNAITHHYPDAAFVYIEDNGVIPAKFSVHAVLAEPNLPAKWRALRSALMRPGPGTLRHPWYGNQFVQVDGTFKVTREDKASGTLEIEIKFAVTGPPVFPSVLSGIAAVVSGLAASTVTTAFAEFAAAYGAPLSAASLLDVAARIVAIGSAIEQAFGTASSAGAVIATQGGLLARDAAAFGSLASTALRAPFAAASLTDAALVQRFAAVSDAAIEISTAAASIIPTTVDLASRQAALALIGGTVEAAAFAGLAEAMAGRAYATADEVVMDELALSARFEALQDRHLSELVHAALRNLHAATSEVLANVIVRLPRISTMRVRNMPASVLAYQLYESDASLQTLVDLNLDQSPDLFAGDVSVLEV